DEVHEDVPLVLLEPDGVVRFPDRDLVIFDDDLRAVDAVGTERHRALFHVRSPPFASICGQTAAPRSPTERHSARIRRTALSMDSSSAARRSTRARTWAHGAEPARLRATICSISASVSPRRRARPTKVSRPSTVAG